MVLCCVDDYEAEMMMLQELMSRNSSASPQHLGKKFVYIFFI